MWLDPVRFLVTPRIIAAVLMTPLLTLFAMLVGMLGGALTMQSFAVPLVTFLKEVDSAVTPTDFMAGFVKTFVFAILIAGVGCLRGLETGAGRALINGSDLTCASEAERRDIMRRFGVMYQSGALFGSMTLLENVRLPLEEYTELPRAAIDLIARMKLELVGLDQFTGHLP